MTFRREANHLPISPSHRSQWGFYRLFAPQALICSTTPSCENDYNRQYRQCEVFWAKTRDFPHYAFPPSFKVTDVTEILTCSVKMPLPAFGTTSKAWITSLNRVKKSSVSLRYYTRGLYKFSGGKVNRGRVTDERKIILHVGVFNSIPQEPTCIVGFHDLDCCRSTNF